MTRKDGLLALLVVVVWGLNFVVIKLGLHNMPPLMLAGLRFLLVAFPALFFVARPKIPLKLLLGYGLTISFGQFAFLFCAIKFGMPAGLASLVLQAQAFFTIILGAFVFGERLQGKQLAGITLPHCFNAEDAVDPDLNYYQGPGWYKTRLKLDNPYPDGRVVLEFEGAGQKTDVYVYMTKVGSHVGGYDSWNVDITDAVRAFLASKDAAYHSFAKEYTE